VVVEVDDHPTPLALAYIIAIWVMVKDALVFAVASSRRDSQLGREAQGAQ